MIIKELFEGPLGDYCIARNTIKCLFIKCFIVMEAILLIRSLWNSSLNQPVLSNEDTFLLKEMMGLVTKRMLTNSMHNDDTAA